MRADRTLVALGTAAFERIGLRIDPDEFQRLVEEAIERVIPVRRTAAPRRELSVEEVRVLEEGGVSLKPRTSGIDSPLARTAAEYAALLTTSLTVPEVARRLGVDGSRVRQRLAAHTLYGIKHGAEWRLPRFQFTERGLVPGFERVAPRLVGVDPVSVSRWFTRPHVDLCVVTEDGDEVPVTPRAWLEAGRDPDVVAALADELQGVA